ncbi:SPOR domain-containing protein [Jonquetella sp. BV3C21]|uniref:Cell division protein n=2 Tax=Jonquetella TaxID=428711 RepID=H0ULC9_9BACT|nr:SPOR domain-containing protein [Jonquetella sp. BV3C21]EHM13488.1 cell division protein [Jonquetella anthropi DSM 22815]ERL24426.1 sporulation and cell division repeat protein [Jonquetella sp. BV3C21]
MPSRSTNRFKQKPALNFGDLMLPVLGIVFLAILIIGIKVLFFPAQASKTPIVVNSPARTVQPAPVHSELPQRSAVVEPVPVQADVVPADARPLVAEPATDKNGQTAVAVAPVKTAPPAKKPAAKPAPAVRPAVSAAPAPVARPAVSAPDRGATIEKSNYLVQSGSFTDDKGASTVSAELKSKGYATVVRRAEVKGRTFFRVFVAGGSSAESAQAVADKLQSAGYPVLVVKNQ